ncbi:MAG: PrsW family intramembrane metalloprotease [Gammaproteobacteria bacterium]|jgi:RsiW-degrading membrane proteinase PrsW (M82 family)|nr:MAG: PrsW family intramembrane metalloprotease [Gammaproteobacteria bacterium]
MIDLILRGSVGLLPVLIFLAVLVYLDSYKLVRFRVVIAAITAGCVAAGSSYFLNVAGLELTGWSLTTYSRYVSPIIEEALKGIIIVYLIRKNRIGFPVDAAIFGFAAGAGFAMIENIYYLGILSQSHLAVWIVRGFGTAIMHGGATAIFAIVAHTLAEESQSTSLAVLAPGFVVASLIHSAFNHFLFAPVLSTLGILILLPPLLLYVFKDSEESLQKWMQIDFDADTELLELINSGDFSDSKVGKYLTSIREHFKPEVLFDLMCYLRLHTELSMRSSGMLMLRESGFEAPPDPEIKGMLEELKYLEKSIGRTGQMAVKPFMRMSSRDLWQLYMLEE